MRRWLIAVTATLSTACGLLAGLHDVPFDGSVDDDAGHLTDGGRGVHDGARGTDGGGVKGDAGGDAGHDSGGATLDASTDGRRGTPDAGADSGHDAGTKGDASEAAAPLMPGQIRCGNAVCDAGSDQECCVSLICQDNGVTATYQFEGATCGPVGGPNCGPATEFAGGIDTVMFPQTCTAAGDCPGAAACCADVADGAPPVISGIACAVGPHCSGGATQPCSVDSECPTGTCIPETNPILRHVWASRCGP